MCLKDVEISEASIVRTQLMTPDGTGYTIIPGDLDRIAIMGYQPGYGIYVTPADWPQGDYSMPHPYYPLIGQYGFQIDYKSHPGLITMPLRVKVTNVGVPFAIVQVFLSFADRQKVRG